nr:ParB/RepB/Spo0J family partition protein [uncultured Dorea sp.]
MNIDDLVVDKEFDELLPVLSPDELDQLEQSILAYGLMDPIKAWEEPESGRYIVIDGHNRYRILKKNNLPCEYWNVRVMTEKDLETREDVKRWMLEQQLGRRNLTDAERYEIVQKFRDVFKEKGKQNQSLGGQGSSNLSKVNTRKEMAKAVGVSEGSYRKLDKVMQSKDEDLKESLRKKEISVDAAYKELKKREKKSDVQREISTPKKQIEKIDQRLKDIDKKLETLQQEKKDLINHRSAVFEGMDIECEVKYRWIKDSWQIGNEDPRFFECQIYLEKNGQEDILGDYELYDEFPKSFLRKRSSSLFQAKIPEKYREDFRMIWKKAYDELQRLKEGYDKAFYEKAMNYGKDSTKQFIAKDEDKIILKKLYRTLASVYHPDNEKTGDAEMMRYVNELKNTWGI